MSLLCYDGDLSAIISTKTFFFFFFNSMVVPDPKREI